MAGLVAKKVAAPVDPAMQQRSTQTARQPAGQQPQVDPPTPMGAVGQPRRQTMAAGGTNATGDSMSAMGGAASTTATTPAAAGGGVVASRQAALDAKKAALTPAAANDPNAPDPNAPVTREVNPETETVAGQLSKLYSNDNPIIDQARAAAMKAANDRGMANSSMATQSGEEAAIGSMMPVAQQDASTQFQQGRANQDTQNQFSLTKQSFEHQSEMQKADITSNEKVAEQNRAASEAMAASNIALGNAQIAASKEMQAASIAAADRQQQFAANTQLTLADKQVAANNGMFDKEASLRRELNLSSLQQNTQVNYTSQVAAILSNHDMGQEDKDAAIRNLNAIYAGSPFLPTGININTLPPYRPPNTTGNPPNTPSGG